MLCTLPHPDISIPTQPTYSTTVLHPSIDGLLQVEAGISAAETMMGGICISSQRAIIFLGLKLFSFFCQKVLHWHSAVWYHHLIAIKLSQAQLISCLAANIFAAGKQSRLGLGWVGSPASSANIFAIYIFANIFAVSKQSRLRLGWVGSPALPAFDPRQQKSSHTFLDKSKQGVMLEIVRRGGRYLKQSEIT